MRWLPVLPLLALLRPALAADPRTDALPDVEKAPRPAERRLVESVPPEIARIEDWFAGHGTHRLHIQLDRPLYRPGESVWIKTWSLATRTLAGEGDGGITYDLVDPRGQVVETKQVLQVRGTATNDFALPAQAAGGTWLLRARLATGEVDERPFVVASYAAPRIKKELNFLREAYGPGEAVEALVALERAAGPLADHPVRALLQVDGQTVLEKSLRTDATGAVFVSARLPGALASGDGLLTVLVDDGGVTESISRSVPIVLADLDLSFFPEGGELVNGLPARVYFEGRDRHGEPADVAGWIADDRGSRVADFTSVHDGMGRVAFTPERGRRYTAYISAPKGIGTGYELPAARDTGCTLRSFDDLRSEQTEVRVAVRCASRQDVFVTGVSRDEVLDTAAVRAGPDADAVVYLRSPADRQGAVRVTVFDRAHDPLAERLVYRGYGRDLRVSLAPDRASYGPRDPVLLDVRTTDAGGRPISAELALSVVDDAVLGLADDEEGNLLTRVYLEPELVESPEDPAWYFDPDEAQAARGVDLVLGTRGWRRFEWEAVFAPPIPTSVAAPDVVDMPARSLLEVADEDRFAMDLPLQAAPPPAVLAPMAGVEMAAGRANRRERPMMDDQLRGDLGFIGGEIRFEDMDYRQASWAPVRVFPRPDHPADFHGPRTDFRDTVHWEPTVTTDAEGRAQVRFDLSDAITAFRITAEGVGGGLAGHAEATVSSVLPLSLATRLPLAVSAGDELLVPVSVSNTRLEPITVGIRGASDGALAVLGASEGQLRVPASGADTWWMPLTIGAGKGTVRLTLDAEGGGAVDALSRELRVVPSGFPRSFSAAGEKPGLTEIAFHLDEAMPGSLTAVATWHPSTMATLITGMEGLIQTPGGCFEQTSSTNWPNVAILSYLEAHDGDPRLRAKSSQALLAGYQKLTGYQVGGGGFETWGSGPGKEALSAFGLLQFTDMKRVYPVADAVLSRDATYLLSQRDGKGGFRNSGESAHGYGSAPPAVLDGFITWALVSTGHADALAKELEKQATVGRTSDDPYVLALAARSLVASHHADAATAVARLAEKQAPDGGFPGAASSITRSGEANLDVESTALSALALMEAGGHRGAADKAASWLVTHRQGSGTWGATQATALALGALSTHAEQNKAPRTSGDLAVTVNGVAVGALHYGPEQAGPLVIDGLAAALHAGDNVIRLVNDGAEALPYTLEVAWTALDPESAPGAELSLETSLDRSMARMGETVRLTAHLANRTAEVVPSPIARIGIPAGLEAQTWQLKELQDRGEIAFFETRDREVTLYWDGVHAHDAHDVKLDLVAAVPGEFTGPASSAYPYYDDDEKAWDAGLRVQIAQPK
jgi:hypothetical protein